MPDRINILFLGGAKRVSLAELFIAAGKKMDKEVSVFSYELDKHVPVASVAEILVGLKWNDVKILDDLKEVIVKHKINIVLPFVDASTVICAKLKTLGLDVFLPVSDEETCRILFDKVLADEWFSKNGFPLPESQSAYPLIAKPRKGSASKGLIIIRSEEELNAFRASHEESNYLIQKYLDADEYSVDAYVSMQGKVISVVPRKRLEVSSGEVTKSITVRDEEIMEVSTRILSSLKFFGPVTLQFLREKKTGKLAVMEINPRFGGGVVTSIAAGANACAMILNEFLHQPLEAVNDWENNLVMARAFREFYYHADHH